MGFSLYIVLPTVKLNKMGIHIIAKTLGKTITEKGFGYDEKHIENERYISFDSIRCSGDTDFIYSDEIEWEFKYDDPENPDYEHGYRRPKDIEKTKLWIQNNIPESNKNRLTNLLNDMTQNQNLWNL